MFSGILRAMSKKKPKVADNTIALNKRARFDYHIDDTFEAGIALAGWEVKSLRAGKAQITDTYVLVKNGEAFLMGAQITPLQTASTHVVADPIRTRKLLLNKKELAKIVQATQAKGMTCVCTALYWKKHLVKAKIGLARGKQDHDKRQDQRDRDWNRTKQRVVREAVKQ